MGAPYSLDLRERVVAAVASGMNRQAVAERFGISLSSTNRWVQRAAATGSAAALPMGGKKPFRLAEQADWINARIAEKPDITGRELLAELHERHVEVSYYAVWNFLDRTGLTFKIWPLRCGSTPGRQGAAWSLENADIRGRPAV